MILITGGISSGKKTYITDVLKYDENQIADAVRNEKPVLYNLQDMIKNHISGYDLKNYDEFVNFLLTKEVISCNEVGSGIIPLNPQDRKWREETGRICILLAKQADKVVRMTCGTAVIIKE